MIHLRIVASGAKAQSALEGLVSSPAVCNVVHLPGAARDPTGDVITADVAREEASVIVHELKQLGVHEDGAISLTDIDTQISAAADRAADRAPGVAADAVVWEEVEQQTSENVELSGVFLAFMVIAALLAMVGVYQDSAILIVGAMVVGPEFGPLAGFCVAAVEKRRDLALRSATALAAGFPLAITVVFLATLLFKAIGLFEQDFSSRGHSMANLIASPDFFTFFVAACAGAAGMLSLSTAKSGALIGVLISVTTIPAAANIGVAAAYGDGDAWLGSLEQLVINLTSIVLAGTAVLGVQRLLYRRRLRPTSRARTRSRPWSAPSRSPHR